MVVDLIVNLDDWQKKVLETQGDICLRSGRQVGKSTVVSLKAAEYAVKNAKSTILIVAAVERQARLLFDKTLGYLMDHHKDKIKRGKDKPTQHKINLINNSVIYCLPTGLTGYGIRGYTVNLLIADEAAFIPEEVWLAVTPMLAATKGTKWLLSTPHGREGYYYSCFSDPNFTSFHVSSEDCPRISRDFLEREKKRLTIAQYAQEYLGEFVDELRQFFPNDLIEEAMILKRPQYMSPNVNTYCGVDVARMGEDESVIISIQKLSEDKYYMLDIYVSTKTLLTDTADMIRNYDRKYHFSKIYIDTTGVGSGVFDHLLRCDEVKKKIISIENASRSLDSSSSLKKRLLKEDLYANLLRMMERHMIELFDDPEIALSLKSVQYEYDLKTSRIKIFGNYTHIVEALVRACWGSQDKHLKLWCA
jgi:hypothetical protein